MNFALAQYISLGIDSNTINGLSQELSLFLANRNYGDGIKDFYIGVTCVHPQFDKITKIRKPKYTNKKKNYVKEGVLYEFEKVLEYDIKIDYEVFINSTEGRKIVAQEILKSLDVLNKLKIEDFKKEEFKADLKSYFNEKGLMTE